MSVTETTEGLRLRRAVPGDAEAIRKLLGSVLPSSPKTAPEVMRWQYLDNPFGQALSFVFESSDEIVSHFARLPVPVRIHGRSTFSSIAVDAATHEAYRGRGLWLSLVRAADHACLDSGIESDIAFRARSSTLPRASARVRTPLARFVLPLDTSWAAERLRIPRPVARFLIRKKQEPAGSVEERSTTPPDIDALWEDVEPQLASSVTKNSAWWSWRFDDHPHKPYIHFVAREAGRLRTVAVARRDEDGLVDVLEVFTTSVDATRRVVSAMASAFSDASALVFIGSRRSTAGRALTAAGFRAVPRGLDPDPLWLNMRDFADNRKELERADWHATLADVDHL